MRRCSDLVGKTWPQAFSTIVTCAQYILICIRSLLPSESAFSNSDAIATA